MHTASKPISTKPKRKVPTVLAPVSDVFAPRGQGLGHLWPPMCVRDLVRDISCVFFLGQIFNVLQNRSLRLSQHRAYLGENVAQKTV